MNLDAIFGTSDHVSLAQECARAALIFFFGLALVRLSGRRVFAKWSALDIIVSITHGRECRLAQAALQDVAGQG